MYGRFDGEVFDLATGTVVRPAEVRRAFDQARPLGPILVKSSPQKPQGLNHLDHKRIILRKKCCGSVWCPKCFKRFHAPGQAARMSFMTWNRVRFVTLTLDRALVGQGEAAYEWYKNTKPLGRFIQDLRRAGVTITDWTANLEWHDDGSPHFHLLIEVEVVGRAGQIGEKRIHEAWPYGRIHEAFFKSQNQFKDFLGYFAKSGYLHKDKQHQIALPGWVAAEKWRGAKINRFSSMRRPGDEERQPTVKIEPPEESESPKAELTYQDRLESCGDETEVWSLAADGRQELLTKFKLPYFILVDTLKGRFEDGLGFVLNGSLKSNLGVLTALQSHAQARTRAGRFGFC